MSPTVAGALLVLLANLAVAIGTFAANPRRSANVFGAAIGSVAALWSLFMLIVFSTRDPGVATWSIRTLSGVIAAAPFILHCLRLAILYPGESWRQTLRRSRVAIWGWLYIVVFSICQSPFFVRESVLPSGLPGAGQVFEPVYGPGVFLYSGWFLLAVIVLLVLVNRDLSRFPGVRRVELQYILVGGVFAGLLGILLAVGLPVITRTSQWARFAPSAVLVADGFIAYGVAMKRVRDVSHVLQIVTANVLLSAYLVAVYALAWWTCGRVAPHSPGGGSPALPHLVAAAAMALSMLPVRGRLRRVTQRLFPNTSESSARAMLRRTGAALQAIGTLPDTLAKVAAAVVGSLDVEDLDVLLAEDHGFIQAFALPGGGRRLQLSRPHALLDQIGSSSGPVVIDTLRRSAPSPASARTLGWMMRHRVEAAVGIRAKGRIEGILLLGPRKTGAVYSAVEQDALQAVGDQLAVAVQNAKLYTQVQNAKLYGEILVDSLVSGVIAVDKDRVVTVFNREAQRITGTASELVLRHPIDVLPESLRQHIEPTLRGEPGVRDRDLTIPGTAGTDVPIRLGSAALRGHNGALLGVLVVFNDMTTVRQLEAQIRRTAHLASVGTLSAGMAHEIKNPLVALKTWAQLLPERYDDEDFRTTFSELSLKEIERIDSIVNRLLSFGRPPKAELASTSLSQSLRESLQLVSVGMAQKRIRVHTEWMAGEEDHVTGDAGLLRNAFVNFLLNAADAMEGGGDLAVSVFAAAPDATVPRELRHAADDCLCARIQDTGRGIAPEDLPRIFDPFFTTKSTGTGLGLSVAHGIIREHGGVIDVESLPGSGTRFTIWFPKRDAKTDA